MTGTPIVERIARVLAGSELSANAKGSDPSAGDAVDIEWQSHIEEAVSVLKTMREPDDVIAASGNADVWRRMIDATLQSQNGPA